LITLLLKLLQFATINLLMHKYLLPIQDIYCVDGLSSKTWNPVNSPRMKQSTWLRIIHSGDWCLQ